jgi:hypothetical protein
VNLRLSRDLRSQVGLLGGLVARIAALERESIGGRKSSGVLGLDGLLDQGKRGTVDRLADALEIYGPGLGLANRNAGLRTPESLRAWNEVPVGERLFVGDAGVSGGEANERVLAREGIASRTTIRRRSSLSGRSGPSVAAEEPSSSCRPRRPSGKSRGPLGRSS